MPEVRLVSRRSRQVSKAETIRKALLALVDEHVRAGMIPTSARFLFYELLMRLVVSKVQVGKRRPDQDMSDQLTRLRNAGDIKWDHIVDETRTVSDFTGAPSIREGVLAGLDYIVLDPWKGKPPFVICESRSLAGVLRAVCAEYCVLVTSTNGQCRGFLHTKVAPRMFPGQHVLYFGDLDLCGGDIEGNNRRVLERIVGELNWERLALTQEQVATYQLPLITKRDKRFKGERGVHEAVETEALSQAVIVDILRTRLEELLPEPLETVQERAQVQRDRLEAYLQEF
jgi:hypothetical protein